MCNVTIGALAANPNASAASGADSALMAISCLLSSLELLSGRYAAAEAGLRERPDEYSDWLHEQVRLDRDPADFCTDAEMLALIVRGRFMHLAEHHGIAPVRPLSLADINPSPWRHQAQRCAGDLPADLVVREATALLIWAVGRAVGGKA
jgi:hypothetical protein